jgi:hypothetical protein
MFDFIPLLVMVLLGGFYLGWTARKGFQRNKDKCRSDMQILGDVPGRMAYQNNRRPLSPEECEEISRRSM